MFGPDRAGADRPVRLRNVRRVVIVLARASFVAAVALLATPATITAGVTVGVTAGVRPVASRPVAALPASKLAVLANGEWHTWWNSRAAPARWHDGLSSVENAVTWRPGGPSGVDWGELRLAGNGEAWRLRVILARVDPKQVSFQLDKAIRSDSLGGAWTVDSAPADALLAMDAGQFSYGRPWGWVVRRGIEEQVPGNGPLSSAIVIDSSGAASLIAASDLARAESDMRPDEAFQSYPSLLTGDGEIPASVRGAPPDTASAIDLAHRDSRLAIGQLRDGKILIALTRFDGLGGVFAFVPFGPTVPEMAAIMGALGCHTSVMLDGGISGQMLLRDRGGAKHVWPGWRAVPMGLVILPRRVDRRADQ